MYTDTLTRVWNAQRAKKDSVKIPFSMMDMAVLEVLSRRTYVGDVAKKGRFPKRIIEVKLNYENGKGKITGIRFLSKPSRHLYVGYKDLRKKSEEYTLTVLSTPKGILTGNEARKEKIGGELLFEIW